MPSLINRGYYSAATPGKANATQLQGSVKDTKFSVNRGFYTDPFSLEITTKTDGAQIYYTLDGSMPTESKGTLYTNPISVTQTTVIRAAAFKETYLPTGTDTQTYFFTKDIIVQSADGKAPGSAWPAASKQTSGGGPGGGPGGGGGNSVHQLWDGP